MNGPAHETGGPRGQVALEAQQAGLLGESLGLTDQFLSVFSHELRTPLNAIVGYADLLSDELGPRLDVDAKRSLDAITRSAVRLTTLINDTLDLARLRMGALRPEVRRFDAPRLVAEVVESFVPLAAAKGLTMACALPSTGVAIQGDAHRLRQTLRYVIDNAVKFTPRGEILVRGATTDSAFVIEVQDSGIGISSDDLPYVFDDFRQIDGGTRRTFDGCGLGLAVSRRLLALMGGTHRRRERARRGQLFPHHGATRVTQRQVVAPAGRRAAVPANRRFRSLPLEKGGQEGFLKRIP